jgi:hypothetical protein
MTNTEINRKLALAIGYLPEHIIASRYGVYVRRNTGGGQELYTFHHQNPTVILPIMERYEITVFLLKNRDWSAFLYINGTITEGRHTNPRTATALAVINAKERGVI